jgi:hypothetical protein
VPAYIANNGVADAVVCVFGVFHTSSGHCVMMHCVRHAAVPKHGRFCTPCGLDASPTPVAAHTAGKIATVPGRVDLAHFQLSSRTGSRVNMLQHVQHWMLA